MEKVRISVLMSKISSCVRVCGVSVCVSVCVCVCECVCVGVVWVWGCVGVCMCVCMGVGMCTTFEKKNVLYTGSCLHG